MRSNTMIQSPQKTYDFLAGSGPSGTARQKDICMAVLLSNPSNFAALFNSLHIFQEKILPEDLEERDSRLSTLRFAYFEEMVKKGQTLYRDIIKLWRTARAIVFLAMESQTQSVPTLPVRSLNYDAANYDKQIHAVRERNRKQWLNEGKMPIGLTPGEFMEKFTVDDALYPLVTAVLFTGEEWNCAKNLNEMFNIPDNFMKDIPSWPLHIINPHTMSDEEIMNMDNNDMKFFMSVIKYSKDKEKMKELIETKFKDVPISPQMGYIAGVITNMKWLENKFKEKRENWQEEENMCLAFDEWEMEIRAEGEAIGKAKGMVQGKAEGKAEGIAEGKAEGIAEGGAKERQRNVLAMYGKGYSAKQIADILEIDLQEVEEIISAFRS